MVAVPSALNLIDPPVGVSHFPTTFGPDVAAVPFAGAEDLPATFASGLRAQEATSQTTATTPTTLIVRTFTSGKVIQSRLANHRWAPQQIDSWPWHLSHVLINMLLLFGSFCIEAGRLGLPACLVFRVPIECVAPQKA